VTLPLQRNGEPVLGKNEVRSTVTLAADLVPVETVFGQVTIAGTATHILRLHVLRANNLRKANWIRDNDVYVQAYRAPEDAETGGPLPQPIENTLLSAGRHVYPFAFPLRLDAPGSAEGIGNERSYIRYSVSANVDESSYGFPMATRPISVVANRPLAQLPLLGPAYRTTTKEMTSCCGPIGVCGYTGDVTVKLTLDRRAYAAGEPFGFELSVDNQTSTFCSCAVYVRRAIVLKTFDKAQPKRRLFYSTHDMTSLIRAEAGKMLVLNGIERDCRVPNLQPSFFGATGIPRSKPDPLVWTYALHAKVHVGGVGMLGPHVDVFLPIILTAAAPYEGLSEQGVTLPGLVEVKYLIKTRPGYDAYSAVSNRAHLSLASSPYFPTIFGEDELANVASVVPIGEAVNVSDGGSDDEDDAAIVVASNQTHYQPVTVLWAASPSRRALENLPAAVVVGADVSATEAKGGDDASEANLGFGQLLQDLTDGADSTRVTEWVRQHPDAAGALTPPDVSTILSAVPLAIDQPPAARALAAGLAAADATESRLTTAHVLAAMAACSFVQVDVAVAMVAVGLAHPETIPELLSAARRWERPRLEEVLNGMF